MPGAEALPLWRQIGRQSVWGPRGLTKAGSVWLALAVALSLKPAAQLQGLWLVCVLVFIAAACRTVASILINDLADRLDDRGTGKDRWIARLSPRVGAAVVAGVFGAGLLVIAASRAPWGALAAYCGAAALAILYSASPFRLKARGPCGLWAYGACCVLGYVVLPWAWLRSDWRALAVVAAAVFLDKWVMVHFHQVVDYAADRERGRATYVVRVGLARARRTLHWAAALASVAMLVVLGYLAAELPTSGVVVVAASGGVAALAAAYRWLARRRTSLASALVCELPGHYLGLTFAVFRILPLLLLARLAIEEPTLWVPAVVAGALMLIESWRSARYRYA